MLTREWTKGEMTTKKKKMQCLLVFWNLEFRWGRCASKDFVYVNGYYFLVMLLPFMSLFVIVFI